MSGSSLSAPPTVFGENEAAVFDTFVIPTYLKVYRELLSRLVLVGEAARVAHLGCRTGYPDSELLAMMPNTSGVGIDPSGHSLTLARGKLGAMAINYQEGNPLESGLPGDSFSHVYSVHPLLSSGGRKRLFAEMQRLLYPGGQALLVLPLGRSFPEVLDLMAEYALKHDDTELISALEQSAVGRLTVESLTDELEEAGLSDVDFELYSDDLEYDSGRAFLEDPATRFMIYPQISSVLDREDLSAAFDYVGRAMDKYWSEDKVRVTAALAALSVRK